MTATWRIAANENSGDAVRPGRDGKETAPSSALSRLGSRQTSKENYMPIPAAKERYSIGELRSLFRYDPETGQIFWREDQCMGRVKAGDRAGCVKSNGYVRIQYKRTMLQAHRVAWALFYGEWPDEFIDHINRDRADNKVENLRRASHKENMRNTPTRSHNRSGMKGVHIAGRRFRARITANGKKVSLGRFDTAEAAHEAYVAAARKLHGEFASF